MGLQYLHSLTPRLMHRDLKPANMLLDDALHVRLADFGLTRDVHASVTMTGAIGTPHYMCVVVVVRAVWVCDAMICRAPEIIEEQRYTEKADIYSVGVIFWEILFGRVPYAGLNPIQIAMRVSSRHLRPEMPPDTPAPLAALIERCWATDPTERPECADVTAALIRIGRDMGLAIEELTTAPAAHATATTGSSSKDALQPTVLVSATVPVSATVLVAHSVPALPPTEVLPAAAAAVAAEAHTHSPTAEAKTAATAGEKHEDNEHSGRVLRKRTTRTH